MDDAGGVGLAEAVGHLDPDVEERSNGHRTRLEQRAQRSPFDELQDDEKNPVRGPELVERDDVRMVEAGDGIRLLLEAAAALGVRGDGGGQHFEGHLAPELEVARAVDLPHPSRAQQGEDLIRAHPRARRYGHEDQRESYLRPVPRRKE